jgi:hypothetical protein
VGAKECDDPSTSREKGEEYSSPVRGYEESYGKSEKSLG